MASENPVIDDTEPEEEAPEAAAAAPPPPPLASTPVEESPPPCIIPEHTIPSAEAAVTLDSPVLETAAEILLEKFYQTSPEDTVSAPQPCGLMPDTNMEVIIPDSPTVSIAALFEDHTVVEEEAHGVDEEEGSTGAAAGDDNAFLQIEESEHSDRGDLERGCESGEIDESSFPTAAMKETREEDGGEDLENAMGDCQVRSCTRIILKDCFALDFGSRTVMLFFLTTELVFYSRLKYRSVLVHLPQTSIYNLRL